MNYKLLNLIFILTCITFSKISTAGEVYLVLGSDTAIWSGMNVNRYNCYYNISLYTDPSANAYQVMDPAFRSQFVDSYGTPMKMTWWMMAGNIFRYAENTNVPIPNIMTMYLMKEYHGDNVITNGDELSLHYHTFYWSDYDGDGIFYWNQSITFMECLDDFKFTLAQFLIDEHVFPVSFRSGWHYMDNDWQNFLDEKILPYSMHNDWPAKRIDLTEPLDNTYDWSLASSEFVPWHPSSTNYQLPGDNNGWNVRSKHFSGVRYLDLMDTVFAEAANGTDQVACFWGHLPENDFLTNLEILDSLAHRAAARYPGVNFRYCTATEAMQLWRESADNQPPTISFNEMLSGKNVKYRIISDEPIFQSQPFVAVKNIYEQYFVIECQSVGTNEWETVQSVPFNNLAKAAVAVCDTMGNQTLQFIEYLPDDKFIDNLDTGFVELYGNWQTSSDASWGTDSRMVTLNLNDSAKAQWQCTITQSSQYNIFVQIPDQLNAIDSVTYIIYSNQLPIDTIGFNNCLPANEWNFLSNKQLSANSELIVEVSANGENNSGTTLSADVIKVTPLVRDRFIYLTTKNIDFGQVSIEDTAIYNLQIHNFGIQNLTIHTITSVQNTVNLTDPFPVNIPAMENVNFALYFSSSNLGSVIDTLVIMSDDPINPEIKLPIYVEVINYFKIIDNEDSLNYQEYGSWFTSNAQAYGPSSRYAWLNANPRAYARFYTTLKRTGIYEIFEIVPQTVNATDDALYQFRINGVPIDSIIINQNQGSGNWVSLGQQTFPSNTQIELRVIDTGNSTNGPVLRADAIKFQLIQEVSGYEDEYHKDIPLKYHLSQNYPNPFNPTTRINFQSPTKGLVKIEIFNSIGENVKQLIEKDYSAGYYSVTWDGRDNYGNTVSSGIYFYRITVTSDNIYSEKYISTKKMIFIR